MLEKLCKILNITYKRKPLLKDIFRKTSKEIRYVLVEQDRYGEKANYFVEEHDGIVYLYHKTDQNIHKKYGHIKDKIIVVQVSRWSFKTLNALTLLLAYLFCKYGLDYTSIIMPKDYMDNLRIAGTHFSFKAFIHMLNNKLKMVKRVMECK